jgi:hypothetical protein
MVMTGTTMTPGEHGAHAIPSTPSGATPTPHDSGFNDFSDEKRHHAIGNAPSDTHDGKLEDVKISDVGVGDVNEEEIVAEGEERTSWFVWLLVLCSAISGLLFGAYPHSSFELAPRPYVYSWILRACTAKFRGSQH